MQKDFPTWCCDDHIVTHQNNQPGSTNPHARRLESPIQMRHNAGRLPSSRIYACRAKMLIFMTSVPTALMRSQFNSDTIPSWYSPEPRIRNVQIKKRWTRHQNFFTHHTLWRPHRDHPGPKPTWWHPLFHVQNLRGSLGICSRS